MSDLLQAWREHDHQLASIAAEMIGAANYFDAHPDFATDAQVAATFRDYVERMRAVPHPDEQRAATTGCVR